MFREYMKQLFISDDSDYNKLTPRVKEEFDFHLNMRKHNAISMLNKCESPIEQLMALNLIDIEGYIKDMMFVFTGEVFVGLEQQKEIKVDDSIYRADFILTVLANEMERKYVIECDGHDFHERTKQQAARDRKRDRQLIKAGYVVLRFTGSEIWKDPFRCTKQVTDIVYSDYKLDEAYTRSIEEDMKQGR